MQSSTTSWYLDVLQSLSEEEEMFFIIRIKESLLVAPGRSFLPVSVSICERFYDSAGLAYCLVSLSDDLHTTRMSLIEAVSNISMTPTSDVLNNAIECHLRPIPRRKVPRCLYCKANDLFDQYESRLFRFNDFPTSDEELSDSEITFRQRRKGTHADSEFEIVVKGFVNFVRHRKDLINCYEDGCNELKLFDAMKKEFKQLRRTWLNVTDYINATDELEMAKISIRLLLPGEEPPRPPVPYIILPHLLQSTMLQFQSDIICHQSELKKKLGQLFYLQNLKKLENTEKPFQECCPVCVQKLEHSWSVLQCGHIFCLTCIHTLVNPALAITKNTILCPLCRQSSSSKDIYYIDSPHVQEGDIEIKGNYSTKVSSIVKCLIKIRQKDCSEKSLVFSTWADFLCLLEQALNENDIPFVNLTNRKDFQKNLDLFKLNKLVNVLLLPLNVGANGLNIIEATNVLLAEPSLDNSKVLQAIGRVHRMGQTRQTIVHQFVIKDTIEENIHATHKSDLSGSSLTVQDLKGLFDDE
ncbi:e3 ubiquitin-protein ligase SHPRH [Trichonephila clavipes]|nr:e3 ubiquitin-protein ligase SHPRH [Trichonephila clavipes]